MNIESINRKDSVCLIDIGYPIDLTIRQKIINDSSLFGIHSRNWIELKILSNHYLVIVT